MIGQGPLLRYMPNSSLLEVTTIFAHQDIGQQLLAEISMYPGILNQQLIRLHPEEKKQINHILYYLEAQGRIHIGKNGQVYPSSYEASADSIPIAPSIWVLLDFLPKVQYHSSSSFPIAIVFFMREREYHIIRVTTGNEAIVKSVLLQQKDVSAKRILLIDAPDQIPNLILPEVVGYCTVSSSGQVYYYQTQQTEAPK